MTTDRDLIDFVYREAELLDDRRFDEWYELFADEGHYWIPLRPDQPDPRDHVSLMYEDRLLLKARIERLAGARAHSQQPESRCQHVLQRPSITARDTVTHAYATRTRYLYVEVRGDEQLVFACTASHRLISVDGRVRIVEKRIDILNGDAPLPMIQLFM